jgi:hypothetical protein
MRLSTKHKTTAEDVRRVLLAAVADALDEGKHEAKQRPGLTGVRAVATGAVIYTAGRAAFAGRRFYRDHFVTDHESRERDEDDDEGCPHGPARLGRLWHRRWAWRRGRLGTPLRRPRLPFGTVRAPRSPFGLGRHRPGVRRRRRDSS